MTSSRLFDVDMLCPASLAYNILFLELQTSAQLSSKCYFIQGNQSSPVRCRDENERSYAFLRSGPFGFSEGRCLMEIKKKKEAQAGTSLLVLIFIILRF